METGSAKDLATLVAQKEEADRKEADRKARVRTSPPPFLFDLSWGLAYCHGGALSAFRFLL